MGPQDRSDYIPLAASVAISFAQPELLFGEGAEGLLANDRLLLRAASTGEDVRSATIVREIAHGERVQNILREVETLTRESGLEHGIASLVDGKRVIVSGGADGIDVGAMDLRRMLLHSHIPGSSAGASVEDALLIDYYFQRSSWLMEVEQNGARTTRFTVKP